MKVNLSRLPARASLTPGQVLDLLVAARSDRLLSVSETARFLGVSEEQLRAWIEESAIPFRLVGREHVFELARLIEWQLRGRALAQAAGVNS